MSRWAHGRQARNDESRPRAANTKQPWASAEVEKLRTWKGTDDHLAELAEELGRTIEACRWKFYDSDRGTITVTETETRTTTTTYRGWMEGDGDGWD